MFDRRKQVLETKVRAGSEALNVIANVERRQGPQVSGADKGRAKELRTSGIVQRGLWLIALCLPACGDELVDCCVDGSTGGVVAGLVVDGDGRPQEVNLSAINFQSECEGWIAPGPWGLARSNSEGEFEMSVSLFLMGPARYCFDMVATQGSATDTIEGLQIRTFETSPPPDTTRLTLVVAW